MDGNRKKWGTNLALGKTYDATGPTWGDQWYGPGKAFDGDLNTIWSPQGLTDQWIAVDFGTPTTFSNIVLTEGDDGVRYLANYVLQYYNGTDWLDIPGTSVTGGAAHAGGLTREFSFNSLSANKVRLKINQAGAGIYLQEMAVYNLNQ